MRGSNGRIFSLTGRIHRARAPRELEEDPLLILRRKEGQWVELTHRSGDTIRVRVYNIRARYPGQLDLAFDDNERNFQVQRPERTARLLDGESAPEGAPERAASGI